MATERADVKELLTDDEVRDRLMSDPQVRARIAEARKRAREGKAKAGTGAPDVLNPRRGSG